MNHKNQGALRQFLNIRGMRGAMTAFAGLIVIYIVFGAINPTVFSGQNVTNLFRSMSKYLIIGIGQSYVLITGNIDLSIGSVVGMSAMIAATLMTHGVNPMAAILITCLLPGYRRGKRYPGREVPASPVHSNPGNHVRSQRRGLYGKWEPQHGCHQFRHRQGSGR